MKSVRQGLTWFICFLSFLCSASTRLTQDYESCKDVPIELCSGYEFPDLSTCRVIEVQDNNVCQPVSCIEIELVYDIPAPFGCPEEFCVFKDNACANRNWFDSITEIYSQVEGNDILPLSIFFWCCMFAFVVAFLILKIPRLLALLAARIVTTFVFKPQDESRPPAVVNIGLINVAILGGKLSFQNFEYISVDTRIRIVEGGIAFRWWSSINSVRRTPGIDIEGAEKAKKGKQKQSEKSDLSGQNLPYRLTVYLSGVEVSCYNNSKRYDEIQQFFLSRGRNPDKDDKYKAEDIGLPNGLANGVPWVYNWFPVTKISVTQLCFYAGEPSIPSTLVSHAKSMYCLHYAEPIPESEPNHTVDKFRAKTRIIFAEVTMLAKENDHFDGFNSLQSKFGDLFGNQEAKSGLDSRARIIGVVRGVFNYVKDIVDEEILFSPPDLAAVGFSSTMDIRERGLLYSETALYDDEEDSDVVESDVEEKMESHETTKHHWTLPLLNLGKKKGSVQKTSGKRTEQNWFPFLSCFLRSYSPEIGRAHV